MERRAGQIARAALAMVVMAGVVTAGMGTSSAAAAGWRVVPSPNTNPYENSLAGVARVPGTSQFWAVGFTVDGPALGTNHSLIEHGSGSTWRVVASPDPNGESHLERVAAAGPRAAWAVGWTRNGGLIERWNGNRWSRVRLPGAARTATLWGVHAFSPKDVLAVGGLGTSTGERPVVLHWNGTAWSVQRPPSPAGCTTASFSSVAAGPGTAGRWAVGECTSTLTPLIERWNGTRWSVVASPPVFEGTLRDVTPAGRDDVWAVGYQAASPGTLRRSLTEHWDGARWRIVPSPNLSATENEGLSSVTRVPGARTVWTVGSAGGNAVALRWNGRRWQSVPPIQVGQEFGMTFSGVAAASARNVVAVGSDVPVQGPPIYATLVERYR